MLNEGQNLFAYSFHGYWKDVGTIDSLWEANMDLIFHPDQLKIDNPEWKIYARNPVSPPHYTGKNADITNSIVSEGSSICGKVKDSVIFRDVEIGEGAIVENCVVMQGASIGQNAVLRNLIIDKNVVIKPNRELSGAETYPLYIGKDTTV